MSETCAKCGNPAPWFHHDQWLCEPCIKKGPDYAPGHYRPGADTNHFLGRCDECDAHYLLGKTLGAVENWYHRGMISQDQYEAYCHVWATSAYRLGDYRSWQQEPTIPEVIRIVALMREIIAQQEEAKAA